MPGKIILQFFAGLLLAASLPALADPPARVGRVSFTSGQVSFRTDKDDEWIQASLNYPVTSHNGFATAPGSRLEIRVGSAAIRVDEDSEISLPRVDDDSIRINVKRGVANVTVRSRESRYPIEVLTPAGQVTLNGPGTYRFEAARDVDQTIVTAFSGAAALNNDGNQISIREGRELVVNGVDPLDYSIRGARRGPFEDWVFARDQRLDRSRSSRYVSPEIAGHEDLDEYGDWQDTSEYGTVWVPRVTAADWAPYRYGRWAWVDPWGWTWVDYSPWGFAPYHYGRWVHYNGYWGWAPGVIAPRPVYAPALVGFIGNPGWSVSFSFGSAPAVGWVPLGYYDLYRPGYRCSPTYVRNVNITNINVRNVNVTNVNWSNPPTPDYSLRKFPHAVTVVPQSAFGNGKPVMGQVAKLNSPVTEPVIGNAPRIAPPARRVVANDVAPGQPPQRAITGPGQPGSPQTGRQALPDQPRRGGREPDNRVGGNQIPGNRGVDNRGPDNHPPGVAPQPVAPQPGKPTAPVGERKIRPQPDTRAPENRAPDNRPPENRVVSPDNRRPATGGVHEPGQRTEREPRVPPVDREEGGRRFPQRDVQPAPRPVAPAPQSALPPRIQRGDPDRLAARQPGAFDNGRKLPQAAPVQRDVRERKQDGRPQVQQPHEAAHELRVGDAVQNDKGGRRVAF